MSTLNYYTLLGLPPTVQVNEAELRSRYLSAIQQSHPDRFVNASEVEKRTALLTSAHLNEAFQTLKNPVTRLSYWIKLHGGDLEKNRVISSDLLMQQMAWREQLDEKKDLPQLKQTIQSQYDSILSNLMVMSEELSQQPDLIEKICENFQLLQLTHKILTDRRLCSLT
jgi:molecular chaperone HscB